MPSCSREPLDDNLTLYKLLEPDGSTAAGYGTALDVMRNQLSDVGATLLTQTKLAGVYAGKAPGSIVLRWTSGLSTAVDHAFLNLPRHALLALAPDSLLFTASPPASRALFNCSRELYNRTHYNGEASVKVYAVYEDAWWGTKLNLWEGEVREHADPPVYIRYHDGPLRCKGGVRPHNGSTTPCKGALLAQYAHTNEDGGGYYLPYQGDPHYPLTIYDGDTDLGHRMHSKLMAMHAAQLQSVGVDPKTIAPPTALVLGYWRHAADETYHPAPDPLSFTTAPGKQLPACVRHLTSQQYSRATRTPLPSWPLMLANNDWWLEESSLDLIAPYWAEVSLRSAERALHEKLGLPRPAWLDEAYYKQSVLRI